MADQGQAKAVGHRLVGKVAVISGAASGIGRATASLFAAEGAALVLCDVNRDGLEDTARLIQSQDGATEVMSSVVDLTSLPAIEQFASDAIDRFGVIDIITNNAGRILSRPIEDVTAEDWQLIHDINVRAPFFLVRYLLPGLVRTSGGSIVNVSSGAGLVAPRPGGTVYSSSKGALISLTRAQAVDLAPHGIRVNCIVPGAVDTPMSQGWYDKVPESLREGYRQAAVQRSPLKRFAQAEELASVSLFLACAESSFMTGAIVPVDGGFTAS